MKIIKALSVATILMLSFNASAWDGYDYKSGSYVEIEKGNLVRSGKDIEIYDYDTGKYSDVTVESINGSGSGVELEVYDYNAGGHRILDMD